jgi:hypothetical protein
MKTMAIQYLEALKEIGKSPSTKFIFPMEFTKLIEPLSDFVREISGEKGEKE